MELFTEVELPFERELVFTTYRDALPELVVYLPNIRSIEVAERRELDGGDVALVNEWVGGGDIPAAVRSIIKPSMLSWTDRATWHADSHTVDWLTEVHAFPGAMDCRGQNSFIEVAGGTCVRIAGDMRCDASKVPAVPRLLRARVGRAVEKFLVGLIGPNLEKVARGVGRYIDAAP